MPLLPITLIAALLHAWVGWRAMPALAQVPGWPWTGVLWTLLLLVSALSLPMAFQFRRRSATTRLTQAITWTGLVCMGLFSSLFVLTVLRDAFLVASWLLVWLAHLAGVDTVSLDALQVWSGAAVPPLALLATAWGFWSARRTASVVRVDVPIDGLPAALQGFTIAQISDIHVGSTIRGPYVQRIVDRVNGLDADMVAITGDLVDGRVADLAAHVAPLSQLVSRHGSFFVTGNHEYYSGVHAWVQALRQLGLTVLLNEHVVLRHLLKATVLGDAPQEASLLVAGVTDFNAAHFDASHQSDPAAAMAGAPAGVHTRLLLAHQPRSAPAAAQAGFQLQISGHTHGGQIWPWNHFVRFQQPFTAGLHRLQRLWVYTNRGTGYWGPPKRFGVGSEITLLRLVNAA